jgi:hypothetical protein
MCVQGRLLRGGRGGPILLNEFHKKKNVSFLDKLY